jgi:hypothetical protein
LAVGVALGGSGVGGGAVAGGVAVLVGGVGRGVADGTGCVSMGARVAVGASGLGLAGTLVGEGNGDGLDVTLGWIVGVGTRVFVARASTTRVLAGVAVTAGFPGAHPVIINPTRPVPARKNQSHRCLFIDKCHTLFGFPPSAKAAPLYSRTEQATSGSRGGERRAWVSASIPPVFVPTTFQQSPDHAA